MPGPSPNRIVHFKTEPSGAHARSDCGLRAEDKMQRHSRQLCMRDTGENPAMLRRAAGGRCMRRQSRITLCSGVFTAARAPMTSGQRARGARRVTIAALEKFRESVGIFASVPRQPAWSLIYVDRRSLPLRTGCSCRFVARLRPGRPRRRPIPCAFPSRLIYPTTCSDRQPRLIKAALILRTVRSFLVSVETLDMHA